MTGRLGAALLQHLLDRGAISRRARTRAVRFNPGANTYLSDAFGLDVVGEMPD